MPAARADQPRQGILIGFDQAAADEARRFVYGAQQENDGYSAAVLAPRLASIWPMASTTASKVIKVEAWRAL